MSDTEYEPRNNFNPHILIGFSIEDASRIAQMNGYRVKLADNYLVPMEWSSTEWETKVIYVTVDSSKKIKTIKRF